MVEKTKNNMIHLVNEVIASADQDDLEEMARAYLHQQYRESTETFNEDWASHMGDNDNDVS